MSKDYIAGQGRFNRDYGLEDETHLYEGSFGNIGKPMCTRGWNRSCGQGISIWRGNIGELGICEVCLKRAAKGLNGIDCKYPRKLKKRIKFLKNYSPLRPGLPLIPPCEAFPDWKKDKI